MKPFMFGVRFKAWECKGQILMADLSAAKLYDFPTIDDCVEWLYRNGHGEVARVLNQHRGTP